VRENVITNTRDLFQGSSNLLYVHAFTAWRIFTIHQGSLQIYHNYKAYTRFEMHNSNLQFSTQEVAQTNEVYKLLMTTKITNPLLTTSYIAECEMKLKKFV